MIPWLLQADMDIGPSSPDPWWEAVAWAMALTVIVGIVIARAALRYYGIDEQARDHLRQIRPQLFRASPRTVVASRVDGFDPYRDSVRELLTLAPDDTADRDETTVREAAVMLWGELRGATPAVPALAIRGFLEGVAILAVGSILFLSAAWWEAAVTPSDASLTAVLWAGLETTWGVTVSTITLFPGSETVWGLVIAGVLIAGEFVYHQWLAVGIALILGGIALAGADHNTAEDLAVRLYPDRLETAVRIAAWTVAVWAIGAIPATVIGWIGSATGIGLITTVGAVLGGTAAALVAGYGLYTAGLGLRTRLVRRQQWPDEHTRTVAGYLLLRKAFAVAVVLALPLLLSYVAMAIGTGALLEWAGILIAAPLVTQVLLAAAALSVVALVVVQFRESVAELSEAAGRAWKSSVVRTWVFSRGVPVSGMVIAFLLTWTLFGTQPIGDVTLISAVLGLWPPLLAAVIVGVVLRVLTLAWERAKYRFAGYEREAGVASVAINCFPRIVDDGGDGLYTARVEGHQLAHRDVDALLEDIATVSRFHFKPDYLRTDGGRLSGGGPPVTFSRYYWLEVEKGRVSIDDVRSTLRGDVRSRITASFRENGCRIEKPKLERELKQDYPEAAINSAIRELKRRGDVSEESGDFVYHS